MKTTSKPKSYGIMHHIPDGYLTRGQVAERIGKSKDTIRRWQADGKYETKNFVMIGTRKVWLYDQADIAALIELCKTVKPGRRKNADLSDVQ